MEHDPLRPPENFVYKEQSTISPNHFNRYLEVVKEGGDVLKSVE